MVREPSSALSEPTPSDPIPDLAENVIGASQYISVSYWTGRAFDLALGFNPGEWVSEQFSGDWEVVQQAGIALGNLKKFNAEFAQEINDAMQDVSHDWEGVAADQARTYFEDLAKTVKEQQETLDGLSQQFDQMATGMYETAKAIKGFLDMLLDYAIAMGLELAAAALNGWNVVGSVAAGAAFAATLTKAMGVAGQALQAHTVAWNSVQATVGVVAGYASALKDIEKHVLPENDYDHPGV
ncbi:hypothetical protein SAMN04487905_11629 [Actinopolyspora xinjiangensis]|uniref:Proteins of 100 residues with WXG n=1 Tax=Actinopolyspora xinjiangensis TaxID=405564 RepID=A0A1H0WUX3_9ACTN|nr:hypothetical protein [Actinopolyspora xinjiangensis]SDP94513.1 hypothetical protein SAMN04487905_11629 [Actinopolyspora xinjiangensis]